MFQFIVLLLPVVTATFVKDVAGATHTCPGGVQNCLAGQPCCAFDPGSYSCCSGGETESCCSDNLGGVCCLNQPTLCIQKSDTSSYPARCCPRETVGCSAGVVGCCNPARAWQRGPPLNPPAPAPVQREPMKSAIFTDVLVSATMGASAYKKIVTSSHYDSSVTNPNVAYLLVVGGGLDGNLQSVHVNLTSGAVLAKMDVTDYNVWDESTRDLAYDPTRNVFYALDVNFTGASGAKRPAGGRPVVLSIINPLDGSVETKTVTGCKGAFDYVTGYAVMENGMIHAASRQYSTDGTKVIGSSFYTVDPTTGIGTDLGSIQHKDESDPKYYGGYHRSVDIEGKKAYRLGYKKVSDQTNPGLGIVHLDDQTAEWANVQTPSDNMHNWYLGMNIVPSTNGSVALSLAPRADTGFLDLVEWTVSTGNITRIIQLGNVTGPGVIMGKAGQLGFVLDSSRSNTWVGVVSFPNSFPLPFPHALDAWGLAVVDMKSGSVELHQIAPRLLSGGNSVSGVGLPKL